MALGDEADKREQEEIVAVSRINSLLARIRVPITVSSLSECVPSLWVAILESLLEARLPGVVRSIERGVATQDARLQNAQAVVWALEQEVLGMELPHIRAENIVACDRETVLDLLGILWEISMAIRAASGTSDIGIEEPMPVASSSSFVSNMNRIAGRESEVRQQHSLDAEASGVLKTSQDNIGDISSINSHGSPTSFVSDALSLKSQSSSPKLKRPSSPNAQENPPAKRKASKKQVSLKAKGKEPTKHSGYSKQQQPASSTSSKPVAKSDPKVAKTPVQSIKRKIQFNEKLKTYTTPPVLRIAPSDTPHMKALKMKRAALLRHETTNSHDPLDEPSDMLSLMRRRHQQVSEGHGFPVAFTSPIRSRADDTAGESIHGHGRDDGAMNRREPGVRLEEYLSENEIFNDMFMEAKVAAAAGAGDGDGDSSDSSDDEANDNQDSKDLAKDDPTKGNKPSQAEKNMDAFEKRVRDVLPILGQFPKPADKERSWTRQLKTWNRALDDRVWTQKVEMQKEISHIDNVKPLDFIRNEAKRTASVSSRRQQASAFQRSKRELNEQIRRIKRMEHRQRVVEEDAKRAKQRQKLKEEHIVKGLMDDYVKAQRKAIIDERRYEKELRQAQNEKRRALEISQQAYIEDQIKLLKEKLAKIKDEETIIQRAREEEIRQLIRDQKSVSKGRVNQVRQKLNQDWDMHYEEDGVMLLRDNIAFDVTPKKR